MDEKKCPLLLAAWMAHYGEYDSMGKQNLYCQCADDCSWYDRESEKCGLVTAIQTELQRYKQLQISPQWARTATPLLIKQGLLLCAWHDALAKLLAESWK